MELKEAMFTMDVLGNEAFSGFTGGDLWNGWACPYFTVTEARRVLDALIDRGDFGYYYSEPLDSFYCYTLDGTEKYEGQIVNVDGQDTLLYPIGSRVWTWEEVTNG